MAMIEKQVVANGRWSDVQTVDNAVAMFESGKSAIALPSKSPKGYSRRGANLMWTTVFKDLSEKRRKGKSAKNGRVKRARDEASESSSEEEAADGDQLDEMGGDYGEEHEIALAAVSKRVAAAPLKKRTVRRG